MIQRFFYGGYNGTTSILLACAFNVSLFLISAVSGMLMLPFISWACVLCLGGVAWGLVAAARNPGNSTSARVMCAIAAFVQICFFVLVVVGMFL